MCLLAESMLLFPSEQNLLLIWWEPWASHSCSPRIPHRPPASTCTCRRTHQWKTRWHLELKKNMTKRVANMQTCNNLGKENLTFGPHWNYQNTSCIPIPKLIHSKQYRYRNLCRNRIIKNYRQNYNTDGTDLNVPKKHDYALFGFKTHHCPCLPNSWCPNESQSSAKSSLKLNLVNKTTKMWRKMKIYLID